MPIHHIYRRVVILIIAAVVVIAAGGCGGSSSPVAEVVLSGTVWVPQGITVDSDVNDPNAAYSPNDDLESAQPIDSPISLGGYVNVPGAGPEGRSKGDPGDKESGDRNDFFRVSLNGGDKVFLATGDEQSAELDLYLLETDGQPVAASIGAGALASVTAPADGTYILNVHAHSGASNYILTIGSAVGRVAGDTPVIDHDFIPGQAIVRFADSPQGPTSLRRIEERAAAWGMTLKKGAPGREVLMTFEAAHQKAAVFRALAIDADPRPIRTADDADRQRRRDTLRVVEALRNRTDILSADPNYLLHPFATTPNDPYFRLQWHYPLIRLPQAWEVTTGSGDVVVAVIDTGVLMDHPDLQGQLTGDGYDFISDPARSNDGDGIDPNPDDPGDGATPGTSSFHGTHVAGTIGARTDNQLGVAGVNWQSKIMPIRALGKGGGTLYDILQGVRYAAGLDNDSGTVPDRPADIINMSFGGGGYSSAAQALFSQVRQAGVILIAAAGNESTDTPTYPAAYAGVIAVSAVDINADLASYSNFGAYIDVAAPGGDAGDLDGDGYPDRVWSTSGDDSSGGIQFVYTAASGTSMATPHVAGVVALMKAIRPGLTPDELDTYLRNGGMTTDIGAPGRDERFGYGLIDAYRAVLTVAGDPPTMVKVDPVALNFGLTVSEIRLTVSVIGSDSIGAVAVEGDADWISITAEDIDPDGLGSYRVRVARGGLADGTYRGSVTATPASGDRVTVPVNLQINAAVALPDAGFHYVLLVDADTDEIVDQFDVQAVDGRYEYRFSGVPRGGRYLIFAGSDRDNDFYIDNAGESFGAYPNLDQISVVVADRDRTDLDFTTDLRLFLPTVAGSEDGGVAWPVLQRLW